MICIYVQYENMNPVRAGVGVCVFLGVREIWICKCEWESACQGEV